MDVKQSAPDKVKPSALRRWAVRLIRIAVVAYLGIVLIYFMLQNYLIFPGSWMHRKADTRMPSNPRYELVSLMDRNGVKITAVFGKALFENGEARPDSDQRPCVLFFYGNGACMAYSEDQFETLRRLGNNVIVPDYEGYGMSEGKASEEGCYAAADAAYEYLRGRSDLRHDRMVASGWSLGGAVAIELASRRQVAGVVTVSTFTNLHEMARLHYPWLPTSLILRSSMDSLQRVQQLSCPMFLAHGTIDSVIPPEMSDRLAAVAKGPVTRFRVEGGNHNDVFEVGGEELWGEIGSFIDRLN